MSKANQATDQEVTPQYLHKKKLVEEEEKRKKESTIVKQFIKIYPDVYNRKGGKVCLCKRMSNGNVHSHYLGRESQVKEVIAKYKAQGLAIVK